MVKKEEVVLAGTKVIVNSKIIKWNSELGAVNNGLYSFYYKNTGPTDAKFEIPVGTKLEIVKGPKQIGEAGVQVAFKVEGENGTFASFWVNFKHKVDLDV